MTRTGYNIGSLRQDAIDGLKKFQAYTDNLKYDTFEFPEDTDYVVPGGKTLYIVKLTYTGDAANGRIRVGYGDDAKDNDVAAPTNAKFVSLWYGAPVAEQKYTENCFIPVPAGKYPFIQGQTATLCTNIQAIEI